jgi:hypothetical protein
MSGRRSAAVVIAVLVGAIIAMAALSAHLAGQRDEATRELARSTRRLADLDSRITDLNHSSARLLAAARAAKLDAARRQPCGRPNGASAHAELVPASGPVGTRVTIVLDCMIDGLADSIRNPPYGLFMIRDFGSPLTCELLAASPGDFIHLVGGGRAVGRFVVARSGACFQGNGRTHRVTPGTYGIGVGCHACGVGTFVVTRS